MIVGSILLAFGIDAAWAARLDRAEEAELLADLTLEVRANREQLFRTTAEHQRRVELTEVLIREAGPERTGVSPDSLRVLADSTFFASTFEPDRGVMTRAQTERGLSLISDPEIRTRVAGFWDEFEHYFTNQQLAPEKWAESLWDTGSLVHPGVPAWESMGSSSMWSDPLTTSQVQAVKYFAFRNTVGEVLVSQGVPLIEAMDSLLDLLEAAQER